MKILIATEIYKPAINGVVTSTLTLKAALEKLGHDVRILTLGEHNSEDPVQHVYRVRSFSIGKLYPGARFSLTRDAYPIQELIDWHPDVIHTQGEFSTFRMAQKIAKALQIPLVHTYHTVYEDYTHYFSPSKRLGKKVVEKLSKSLLEKTVRIIAPTVKVKKMLERYGVDEPVSVIPTGLPLAKFKRQVPTADKQQLKQQLGLSADDFVLVSLGRLGKEKNIQEIIHFLKKLALPQVHLVIVGDGPYREALEALVQELDLEAVVHFVGMVCPEQVPLYYQIGDLFVSGSTSETQGLTYIEAFASGLPALCRADDSLTGVIEHGVTGFQYHNFNEFQNYLTDYLEDEALRTQVAQAAQQLAIEKFSAEAFAECVLNVYQAAINAYASE